MANQDFVLGYPNHSALDANRLERVALKLLEYRVGVLPSAYARSYFGLRAATTLMHEKSIRHRQLNDPSCQSSSSLPFAQHQECSVLSTTRTPSRRSSTSSSLSETDHRELRRHLVHIIHGTESGSRRTRRQSTGALTTSSSSSRDQRSSFIEGKNSWILPVRQAGQFLRKAFARTAIGRRNTVSECNEKFSMLALPLSFHRSIIAMAIHPYLNHRGSPDVPDKFGEQPQKSGSGCDGSQGGCEIDPLMSCSEHPIPGSAPPTIFRRSLSFESLPTLKKGLRVNNPESQPPIIGKEEPTAAPESRQLMDSVNDRSNKSDLDEVEHEEEDIENGEQNEDVGEDESGEDIEKNHEDEEEEQRVDKSDDLEEGEVDNDSEINVEYNYDTSSPEIQENVSDLQQCYSFHHYNPFHYYYYPSCHNIPETHYHPTNSWKHSMHGIE